MQRFQDLVLLYKRKIIQVSPMTLLDYGFLRQMIFTSPEQTDRVTRKLAICINNLFAKHGALRCQVLIQSKMPEWTNTGNVILAQHIMYLSSHWPFSRIGPPIELIQDECPWPCSKSPRAQIRHHRAKSIASNLGDDEHYPQSIYNLVCEDSVQKIRSTEPIQEVPFIFYTKFQNLVKEYQIEGRENQELSPEITSEDNGRDYWDNLSCAELQNIDNMMEW